MNYSNKKSLIVLGITVVTIMYSCKKEENITVGTTLNSPLRKIANSFAQYNWF